MKRICLLFACFIFVFSVYSSDFSKQISWFEGKLIPNKRLSSQEFELLKPSIVSLLEAGIYKEDVYAILSYLLREKIGFKGQLTIFKELAVLIQSQKVPSKSLRNFISKEIRLARVRGKKGQQLVDFLMEEIEDFSFQARYKRTEYELINQPTQK
ncbi:MAG: hypothetical protein JW734_04805 [Candidatus Omnitrophica bacterium]|nr:hypothetical protein [Candidatus Omnitrophota bacterium]